MAVNPSESESGSLFDSQLMSLVQAESCPDLGMGPIGVDPIKALRP